MKLKIRIKPEQFLSDLFRRFAPSAIICALLTATTIAYYIVGLRHPADAPATFDTPFTYAVSALGMGLLFATTASVLCERYNGRKLIPWTAAVVGAGTGALLFYLSESGANVGNFTIGLIICCLALCLHAVSLKDAPAPRLLFAGVWLWASFAISGVIFAALSICGSAIFALLAQNASSEAQEIFYISSAFISFLLAAPYIYLGGLPAKDAAPHQRINRIFCLILLPMYLAFLSILLLYVAKIAVTLTMPVGVMNSYGIAALTLFAMFHLVLTDEENKLLKWFKNWGALLLVPIIVVQGIGVWMRVSAYGLTEMRVLGLVWTLLCIAVVITSLFRKRANWFFLAAAVIAVINFCTPLSARNMAIMDQESRLSAALERNGMMTEQGEITAPADPSAVPLSDREIIYSAINYLEDVDNPRAGSLTAQLHAQTEELAEDWEYSRLSSYTKERLLGFEEPQEDADSRSASSTKYYYFYGGASSTQLDTRGYAYAEYITVRQVADAAETTVTMENASARYGTTDMDALFAILEDSRRGVRTLVLDIPVTFMIDGEEIDIAPLLNGAVFDGNSADMTGDTLILPSGKKLHFKEIRIADYSSDSFLDNIYFNAWLLTPEEE